MTYHANITVSDPPDTAVGNRILTTIHLYDGNFLLGTHVGLWKTDRSAQTIKDVIAKTVELLITSHVDMVES